MTLYLKYRPQKISELDLEQVRKSLLTQLSAKSLAHAWLFCGSRGLGKTSAARILAKVVNCNSKKDGDACLKCESCVAIGVGSSPDVIEIDAASNRGIDEIRQLRDNVALAPMQSPFKVYIIDEVHMLTTEAANALLKTLEEPPAHVMFVLCTTEPEKLPETVVSRCAVVRFGRPGKDEVLNKLAAIVKEEKVKLEKTDLEKIVTAAKGSFRDAIKILEQVISSDGKMDEVLGTVVGLAPEDFFADMSLEFVDRLVAAGVSMRGFIERCVEYLRLQMRAGEDVMGLIEGLEKAYERTKTTAVEQLPLEIFVVENTRGKKARVTSDVIPNETKSPEESGSNIPVSDDKKERLDFARDDNLVAGDLDAVLGKWADVMKAVRPMNHSVEALLRSTRPVDFDGERLTLEVFYKFHKDKLESDKCRQIVESAVSSVMPGHNVKLQLRLGEKMIRGSDVSGADISDDIVAAAAEIFKVDVV